MTEDRAISLNAVIKAVDKHTNDDGTLDDDISCILEDLPPVTSAEPKTGYWKERRSRATGHIEIVCSECGAEKSYPYNDYCGNCGAKMVEEQKSEKINCKATKCENCKNHNYCDYESQERSDKE